MKSIILAERETRQTKLETRLAFLIIKMYRRNPQNYKNGNIFY